MILLILSACNFELPPGLDFSDETRAATAARPDLGDAEAAEEEPPSLASCLASGGSLVPLGESAPLGEGYVDLEVGADGTLFAVTAAGHLMQGPALDLASLADAGTFPSYASSLDLTGDALLVGEGPVAIGVAGETLDSFVTVAETWGDNAISPDGSTVAWTWSACGVVSGATHVASGTPRELVLSDVNDYALGLEFLDDGRLVAKVQNNTLGTSLVVLDGDTLLGVWPLSDEGAWSRTMEVLGTEVVVPTGSEEGRSRLDRVDLDGVSTTLSVPLASVEQVALDPNATYALGRGGEIALAGASDGLSLGTVDAATDLVADPEGDWLATAGSDGVIRVFTCE